MVRSHRPNPAARFPSAGRCGAQRGCARTAWTRGACSSVRLLPLPFLQTLSTWRGKDGAEHGLCPQEAPQAGPLQQRDAGLQVMLCTLWGHWPSTHRQRVSWDSSLTPDVAMLRAKWQQRMTINGCENYSFFFPFIYFLIGG